MTTVDGAGARAGQATEDRKADHIRLALDRRMQVRSHYFDEYVFEHDALPELAPEDVETRVDFLGRELNAPLLVSCMTGGTEEAGRINRNLAGGAEAGGVALGVGSQRKAIEDPAQAGTFQVRGEAPSVPLLANLGAVQLNYGFGLDEARAAVEMIEADALVFHLNVLQEALQPEGDTNFRDLVPKIGRVSEELEVPVIAKEIGCGISADVARRLREVGVEIVDVAGQGGTSWARIEARRSGDLEIGEMFADWGIPTPRAIRQVAEVGGVTVIGSGGVRSGIDVAKAVALGADLVGMAYPFLEPATESVEMVARKVQRIVEELRIVMLCVGARTIQELQQTKLRRRTE